jgi:hypothetical protein
MLTYTWRMNEMTEKDKSGREWTRVRNVIHVLICKRENT